MNENHQYTASEVGTGIKGLEKLRELFDDMMKDKPEEAPAGANMAMFLAMATLDIAKNQLESYQELLQEKEAKKQGVIDKLEQQFSN